MQFVGDNRERFLGKIFNISMGNIFKLEETVEV